MPRTGVAYNDVADSIHTLEKAGLKPSIRMIREKIGRGSLTTIAEHKRAYETQQASGPGPALPDPIAKHLLEGAQVFWEEVLEAAEADIEQIRAQGTEAKTAWQARLEDLEAKLARERDKLGATRSTLANNQQSLTERDAEIQVLTSKNTEQRQQTRVLEAQLRDAVEREKALESELRSEREATIAVRAEVAQLGERLEAQARENATAVAALKRDLNDTSQREREAQQSIALLDTASGELKSELAKKDEQCREYAADIRRYEANAQQSIESLAAADNQVETLAKQLTTIETKLATAETIAREREYAQKALIREKNQRIDDLQAAMKRLPVKKKQARSK